MNEFLIGISGDAEKTFLEDFGINWKIILEMFSK
jgi:hypothetical protein